MTRPPTEERGVAVTVRGLERRFRQRGGRLGGRREVQALRGIDLDVPPGTTLGVVGESGCGKTTLARIVAGLDRPSGGTVRVGDTTVESLGRRGLRELRRTIQYVFQDPLSSLDPRMRVGAQIVEPLVIHGTVPRAERRAAAVKLLERVGLGGDAFDRFPHEFSGGQRQRIGIARSLAVEPRAIVADEPVSALDVSVQAQILNLLLDLQRDLGLTMLFIAHDLSVVEFVSDAVAVMYLGSVVELAPRALLFGGPRHPYTAALLASAPSSAPERRGERLLAPEGEPPSPLAPPPGCAYHPRCPSASERCRRERPALTGVEESAGAAPGDHKVACFHPLT